MPDRYLDAGRIATFSTEDFTACQPFPWHDFNALLTPEAFASLYRAFPPMERFEKHVGMKRAHGQRPHDRFYLAYEASVYDDKSKGRQREAGQGEIRHEELSMPWQAFLEELESNQEYRGLMARVLGRDDFQTRYAWHVGTTGSEVSPHRDSESKAATHIFYFNTQDDWDAAWGGSTVVLGGKKVTALNPDFSDFETITATQILDNHSFLFQNTPDAWHGVEKLTCPEGRYRRLFNVIFETPDSNQIASASSGGLAGRLRGLFRK